MSERIIGESIGVEPDWDKMRKWVRLVARTEPEHALTMAAAMGREAPDLSDLIPEAKP